MSGCTAINVVTHTNGHDPARAPAGLYRLDPHHASVTFDVDHFGYSRFVMRFDRVQANLTLRPEDPEKSSLTAVIDAASFDSNVPALDDLVRGPDLLDAELYPEIRYTLRSLRRLATDEGEMTGDLTLHGETHPVTLAVRYNGGSANPMNNAQTLGFSATGTVDRAAFGLTHWYPAVGNQVRLSIQAEFTLVE